MRPWRLTRRQRVEMEAALSMLRGDAAARAGVYTAGVYRSACIVADPRTLGALYLATQDRPRLPLRDWRILRARVALALRAALRADEDARCEEARAAVVACYARTGYSDEESGALEWCDALREWPAIPQPYGVPRALWEAAR